MFRCYPTLSGGDIPTTGTHTHSCTAISCSNPTLSESPHLTSVPKALAPALNLTSLPWEWMSSEQVHWQQAYPVTSVYTLPGPRPPGLGCYIVCLIFVLNMRKGPFSNSWERDYMG